MVSWILTTQHEGLEFKRDRYPRCHCILVDWLLFTHFANERNLEANTYSNHLFKFQIQLPQGWTINDKASYRKAAAWQDSDSQESEATDAAEEKISKQLLFISELPFGAPAESNDSIVMIAVDLSGEPNFKTAKDYQVLLINSLKTNDESRKLVKEPFLTKLGAKEFWRTDFEINVLSQGLYQANFTTLESGTRC